MVHLRRGRQSKTHLRLLFQQRMTLEAELLLCYKFFVLGGSNV